MSRRTPPLKIEHDAIADIAALSPVHSGRLLAWGWRCYCGEEVLLDKEKQHDPEAVDALLVGAGLLDAARLQEGKIVVSAFESARVKAEQLSRTRAKAREGRFSEGQQYLIQEEASERLRSAEPVPGTNHESLDAGPLFDKPAPSNPLGPRLGAGPGEGFGQPVPAAPHGPLHPSSRSAAMNLAEFGMLETDALALVLKLEAVSSPDEIVSATIRMRGRAMLSPGRYLEKMLENERQAASQPPNRNSGGLPPRTPQGAPDGDLALAPGPVAVRRQVAAGPIGQWNFVGWTSREHPKGDGTPEGRFKVWRTDSGKLSYKRADGDMPPSFEDDPGIYEVD